VIKFALKRKVVRIVKKFKQVLALGLAGAVVAGTVGCGPKTNTGNNSGKPTGDSDVVTLKWVAVGSGMPKNYDKWAKKVNEYLGKKIGVNIDMQVVEWGSWSDKKKRPFR
jgi:putative aldouronate transport system substrate-binding protein